MFLFMNYTGTMLALFGKYLENRDLEKAWVTAGATCYANVLHILDKEYLIGL